MLLFDSLSNLPWLRFLFQRVVDVSSYSSSQLWLCIASVRPLTCECSFAMRSPDVKDFLQMDKSKNLSDASEDEDDKVGILCF